MNPLDAALGYAARGWRVIPIKPGSKFPKGIGAWQDRATTDPTQIGDWWATSNDGVGIATGPGSGLFVVDIDVSGDKRGDDTLAELEQQFEALPDTVECVTGSGGRHIYFTYPAGLEVRNDAGSRLGPGIDIRGEGGQVLAPPTVHPNGQPYCWLIGFGPDELDVADAPAWLLDLLTRPVVVSDVDPPDIAISLRRALTNPTYTNLDQQSDDGPASRFNDRTTWPALLTADGWTLDHTDRGGEQHWVRPGKDARDGTSATVGHEGRDVLRVFTTSLSWLPEGAYSRFGYHAARNHHGDRSQAARELKAAERPTDAGMRSLVAPADKAQLDETAASDKAQLAPAELVPPELDNAFVRAFVVWPELFDVDRTAADWLLEPLIARGRAHAMFAGAKTGKSFVLLAACAALASGRPFLAQPAGAPVSVLYADYEMTPDDLRDRLEGFGYGPGDLAELHYALLPAAAPLDTPEGARAIVDAALAVSAQLVIIDTTSRAVQGAENDADTMRAFYRWTGINLKAAGIAWVRVDHAGKDGALGQRGTSAKNDDVDVVWRFQRREEGSVIEATHRRMAWVPDKIELAVAEDDAGLWTIKSPELDDPRWPAETGPCVADLERLGVPIDATVRRAAAILKDAKCGRRQAIVSAGVKFRKWRLNKPGNAFFVDSGNEKPVTRETNPEFTIGNAVGNTGNTAAAEGYGGGGVVDTPVTRPDNSDTPKPIAGLI